MRQKSPFETHPEGEGWEGKDPRLLEIAQQQDALWAEYQELRTGLGEAIKPLRPLLDQLYACRDEQETKHLFNLVREE